MYVIVLWLITAQYIAEFLCEVISLVKELGRRLRYQTGEAKAAAYLIQRLSLMYSALSALSLMYSALLIYTKTLLNLYIQTDSNNYKTDRNITIGSSSTMLTAKASHNGDCIAPLDSNIGEYKD